MVRITIDDELKQKLLSAGGIVELCDVTGKVVARFEPESMNPVDRLIDFPELTPEEIDRRCRSSTPGLSTEQVKQRLGDLDKS